MTYVIRLHLDMGGSLQNIVFNLTGGYPHVGVSLIHRKREKNSGHEDILIGSSALVAEFPGVVTLPFGRKIVLYTF